MDDLDITQVECAQPSAETLAECLEIMHQWALENKGRVNVWDVVGPYFSGSCRLWFARIYYARLD